MAVASTVTLESRAKRHPSSSLTGFPASSKTKNKTKKQELERLSQLKFFSPVHGFAHGDPCSLHFWMSCYAQSFWANEQSVAQQSPTVSIKKHPDCWQVLLHLHFLLPSYCTARVLGHVLVHKKSTIAKGLIHWWVPPSWHMSQRYTDNHLA